MRKIVLLLALFPMLFASQVRADKLDILIKNQNIIRTNQQIIFNKIDDLLWKISGIGGLKSEIENLKTKIRDLEWDINSIDGLKSKIDDLQSTINRKLGY